MMNRVSIAAAIGCVSILCGCASSDRVVKTYEDPDFTGRAFANVLVVGVHQNATTRRRFESAVAEAIRARGAAASPSLNFMLSTDDLSRDSLLTIVKREGFDAVLVTRLLDAQVRVENREGRSTAEAQRRNDIVLADFFRYDYIEYKDPMVSNTVSTVILATDLYDVASESKIWSVESSAVDKASVYETIKTTSSVLATALSRDGLITR